MTVNKFSVSLPEALLAEVDELAHAERLTRSAVIREGMSAYVASRKSARRHEERRARIEEALDGLDLISQDWGPDERDGLDYLREVRGEAVASESGELEARDTRD